LVCPSLFFSQCSSSRTGYMRIEFALLVR